MKSLRPRGMRRLPVHSAAPFDRDVVQVLAVEQGRLGVGIELAAVERGVQRGACLQIDADSGAQVQLARSILARRQIDCSAARLAAFVDGALNGGPRVVLLTPSGAIILDVEHRLSRHKRAGGQKQQRCFHENSLSTNSPVSAADGAPGIQARRHHITASLRRSRKRLVVLDHPDCRGCAGLHTGAPAPSTIFNLTWIATQAYTQSPVDQLIQAARSFVLISLSAILLLAQTSQHSLSVEDVVKMTKAGLSDDVVVSEIRKSGHSFDLTPDQLISLKTAKVSDRVIQAMLEPAKSGLPASAGPGSGTTPAPGSAEDGSLPTELGVYAKKGGVWTEVLPEVVNFKTGGVLKSFASAGVVKGDVNGNIDGAHSKNSFASPLEILVVVPEGTAITEYQFLRLRENKDYREFRTVTGGVMHVKGGATRDLVPFESKKVAVRKFSIVLPSTLGAGEYGFLQPGASSTGTNGAVGKIYSFHLIE